MKIYNTDNLPEINPHDFFIKTQIIINQKSEWISFAKDKEIQLKILKLEN